MSPGNDKFIGEGLTYDDVLLIPAYSEVLPLEVNISSLLTKNIKIISTGEGAIKQKNNAESMDIQSVNYIGFIPVLIEAIKEQQQMIEDLKQKNVEQDKRIKELEEKNK